jgi:hypothetical protein
MSLTAEDEIVIGRFREVRAAAQALDRELLKVLADVEGKAEPIRAQVLAVELPQLVSVRDLSQAQIMASLVSVEAVAAEHPEQRRWAGDVAVSVKAEWAQVLGRWPAVGASADQQVDAFRAASARLDMIVYWCEYLGLTPELGGILDNVQIGKSVSIESVLQNELPRDPELRQRLIRETVEQDGVLACGYLDADAGLIYRVGATPAERRSSVWRLLGALVLCVALLALASFVRLGDGWPFSSDKWLENSLKLGFLMAGAGAHLVIQGITVARRRVASTSRPWNDWVTWLNAHETLALSSIAGLLFVYVMLSFTMKGFAWQTAFFAGYSSDSLLDVFLDRFEQLATKQGKQLAGDTGK